ncbi:ComF family protein [Candidatus Parcubacteria bacterium]|nr:ComF family protein [Candidatus Parcubacteria bacterium]
MDKILISATEFLLELFFPSFCLGCRKEGVFLCSDCQSTLEISEYAYCLCNKNPQRLPSDSTQGKCSHCRDKKLSGLWFALPYQEKALTRKLIYQFKYEPYLKSLAKPLAAILAEHLIITKKNTEQIWENSFLMPVPMEIKKMKKRGYNQAGELAKELSKIITVPAVYKNLIKTKRTQSQTTLSAIQRQKNQENAFALKNPGQIRGKKIFLVDDVYTTGATMEECARVLKDAGAKQVWGIAFAREA